MLKLRVFVLFIIFGMFQNHFHYQLQSNDTENCNNLFRVWVSPLKNRAQSRKYRPMTISNQRDRNTEKNPKIQCHVNQNQTSKRKIFENFYEILLIWKMVHFKWAKLSRRGFGPQDLIFGQLVGYIGTPSSTPNQLKTIKL